MASRKIPSPAPPPSPRGPQLPRTTNSLASPDVHSKATSPRTLEPYKVAQDLLQRTHSPAQAVKPRPTMAKAATTNSFSHPSDRAKTRYSGREATMTDSFSHPSGRAKTRYSGSRYGGLILLPKRSSQDLL
ncbi:hypothetical protein BHM03_00016072 [Ensete ventricosum]|nr:hypothetical protein BHM03_00016072 [Ensete ventricosum]